VRQLNEYQKQAELFFKVATRLIIAWWVLGLLQHLPDSLTDKIVNKLIGMIGL
jgi:hypothetical protein